MIAPDDIIRFWFEEIDKQSWFKKDADFDQMLMQRFGELHSQAEKSELYAWRSDAHGRLAEIIVLDQFSRNLYRDSARAFASDPLALALAQEAVSQQLDRELNTDQRTFLYMPYMHSESAAIHEVAVQLFEKNGKEDNLDFEMRHKAIIDRFGRYPHRNATLGRQSTAEELEFLQQPGSSF
jgi:uncharacterized protein (DUF924 family)